MTWAFMWVFSFGLVGHSRLLPVLHECAMFLILLFFRCICLCCLTATRFFFIWIIANCMQILTCICKSYTANAGGACDCFRTKYYTFISMKIRCETYQTWWLRWRETPWRRPVGLHSTTSFSASAKWPRTKIVQKSPKFQHKCLTVEWEHTQILYYSWGYTSLRFSPSMPTI